MCKNWKLARIIIPLFMSFIFSFVFLLWKTYVTFAILFLIWYWISYVWVMGASQRLTISAAKKLDNCDPYPLLKLSEEILSFDLPEKYNTIVLLNYSVALRELGEYEKAYSILSNINIDKFSSTLPSTKIIYYNNLTDICILLNLYPQAEIWSQKLDQHISTFKNQNLINNYESFLLFTNANKCIIRNDTNGLFHVLRHYSALEQKTPKADVEMDFICGKAYFELGDYEKAKLYLSLVENRGKSLHRVIEAQELLSKMQ